MAKTYDNNLTGALFKNDKAGNEKRPDYTGSAEIEGVHYWISSWIKEGKNGQKFMSLSFKPKEEKPQGKPANNRRDEDDGQIPF